MILKSHDIHVLVKAVAPGASRRTFARFSWSLLVSPLGAVTLIHNYSCFWFMRNINHTLI